QPAQRGIKPARSLPRGRPWGRRGDLAAFEIKEHAARPAEVHGRREGLGAALEGAEDRPPRLVDGQRDIPVLLVYAGERAIELRRAHPRNVGADRPEVGDDSIRAGPRQDLRRRGKGRGLGALAGFKDDEPEQASKTGLELLREEL